MVDSNLTVNSSSRLHFSELYIALVIKSDLANIQICLDFSHMIFKTIIRYKINIFPSVVKPFDRTVLCLIIMFSLFLFFLSFLGGSYGVFDVLYYHVCIICFHYMGSPYKQSISSLGTTRHTIQ